MHVFIATCNILCIYYLYLFLYFRKCEKPSENIAGMLPTDTICVLFPDLHQVAKLFFKITTYIYIYISIFETLSDSMLPDVHVLSHTSVPALHNGPEDHYTRRTLLLSRGNENIQSFFLYSEMPTFTPAKSLKNLIFQLLIDIFARGDESRFLDPSCFHRYCDTKLVFRNHGPRWPPINEIAVKEQANNFGTKTFREVLILYSLSGCVILSCNLQGNKNFQCNYPLTTLVCDKYIPI